MMSYDPERLRTIMAEIELSILSNRDLVVYNAVADCLDKNEEIPRWLFVKLTALLQRIRSK